ncbi:hypothetical protein KSAC_19240 [Komagataeibacter saccharivorans]|uniref:hypothetical protein n=1 Tax=Komagataeibacter saccharivorans TaxID=265959 RepID=UPI00104992E8|nr:hypothetical protein [Komagataeibacter saccharivorans]QBL94132.1 hypothetical protein KSAC_19240 [Komagataeibacter saccharivorans]
MSHNYATPLTPEKRLTRVLSRIPDDWSVNIDRQPDGNGGTCWRARLTLPGDDTLDWTAPQGTMVEALETAWRQARALPGGEAGPQVTVKN